MTIERGGMRARSRYVTLVNHLRSCPALYDNESSLHFGNLGDEQSSSTRIVRPLAIAISN